MKFKRVTAALLAFIIFGTCVYSRLEAESYDRKNAMAGASEALAAFYNKEENPKERILQTLQEIRNIRAEQDDSISPTEIVVESKDDHITEYEEPVFAAVSAEVMLNVRKRPTSSGDLAGQISRGAAAKVIGEAVVNGKLWYHIQMEEETGYAVSSYLLFGDEAASFVESLDTMTTWAFAPDMPKHFTLSDDLSKLSDDVVARLKGYIEQINYCLDADYPAQKEAESFMGMYSILLYLIENYMHVQELAFEYGLDAVYATATTDLVAVENNREYICNGTGQTGSEIEHAISEKQAEEARLAQEKAAREAAEAKLRQGIEIAQYASSFIGSLPYVWGGASLTHGADCSGFVSQIMAHYGLLDQSLANMHGYDSTALRYVGYEVPLSQIQAGDIVCYNGHVAIYYGNGIVVHEPSPGKKCSFGDLYMARVVTVRRLI